MTQLFKYKVGLDNNTYEIIEAAYFTATQDGNDVNAYFYVKRDIGDKPGPSIWEEVLVAYVLRPRFVTFYEPTIPTVHEVHAHAHTFPHHGLDNGLVCR